MPERPIQFFLLHEILQAEALSRPQTPRMVPVSDLVGRFKRQSPLAARGQCPISANLRNRF